MGVKNPSVKSVEEVSPIKSKKVGALELKLKKLNEKFKADR